MPVNRVIVESSRRILFQSKSASDAGGVWRTTDDGSRIFIKDGEARAGGPNGKPISGSKKPASGDKQSSGEKPAPKKKPATFAAKDMPADMAGEVEVFDPDTGQLFDTVDASAAREMFAAQMAEYGNLDGLAVRASDAEAKAERAKAEKEFWDKRDQQQAEARRQEELKTPHGLRPGHDKFVAPPEVLYHATFNADEIVSDGFKSSDDLGKQVLGGSASHLVSFTTKENAEIYRNGLEHARLAARGELSDGEMIEAATQYNVTADRARKLMIDARQSRGDASHEFFQRVAMEGKTFPLFMGGSWPEAMKTAKPAEIVGVPSADATDLYYNPGETEWRVGGYRKLNPRRAGKAKALRAGQAKSGCGANAKGGGGFQAGNDCASGAGSGRSGDSPKPPKDAVVDRLAASKPVVGAAPGKPGDKVEVSGARGPVTIALGPLEGERFNDFANPNVAVPKGDLEVVPLKEFTPREPVYEKGDVTAYGELKELASKHGIRDADSAASIFARWVSMGMADEMGITPEIATKAAELRERASGRVIQDTSNQDDDGYLYHVTTKVAAADIKRGGLQFGKDATFAGYAAHSAGRVFLTERSGVEFWREKVEEASRDFTNRKPKLAVFRVKKESVHGTIRTDREGTRDAPGVAYFIEQEGGGTGQKSLFGLLALRRWVAGSQVKSKDGGDGVWRTTDDGSKIFIGGDGEVRAGGPGGPVIAEGDGSKQTSNATEEAKQETPVDAAAEFKKLPGDVREQIATTWWDSMNADLRTGNPGEFTNSILPKADKLFENAIESPGFTAYRGVTGSIYPETPGEEFTDKGFLRASSDQKVGEGFAPPPGTTGQVVTIKVPEGTKYLPGDHLWERELYFQRGATLKTTAVEYRDNGQDAFGKHHKVAMITAEIVQDKASNDKAELSDAVISGADVPANRQGGGKPKAEAELVPVVRGLKGRHGEVIDGNKEFKSALRDYMRHGSSEIAAVGRGAKAGDDVRGKTLAESDVKKRTRQIETIDAVIRASSLGSDETVYRGFKGLPGSADEARQAIGRVLHDPSLVSTSLYYGTARSFAGTGGVIEVAIGASDPAFYAGAMWRSKKAESNLDKGQISEAEVLLPRGTAIKITGVREIDQPDGGKGFVYESELIYEKGRVAPKAKSQSKSCGANAKGGGGFQAGNDCASGGGSGDSDGESVAVAEKRKVNPKVLAWAEGRYKDKAKAKNFAEWFGDSKVVDADGNPLVVYHGTSADFDSFKDGSNMFATNENYSYIKSSDRVIPVYLSLQNPYFTENQKDAEGVNYWDDWVAELKAKGHDGVIYSKKGDITKGASGWGNDYSQIAVFDNTAIKSAIGNRGTFASGEADITKSFDSDRMGASAVGRWLAKDWVGDV